MAKVLVADDSALLRARYVATIGEMGLEAVEAEDGAQALAAYREHRPHAVLLEVTLPKVSGLDVLKSILSEDPAARVAMVTGIAQQQVVVEAMRLGARDYVAKPFEPGRLKRALEKLLGNGAGAAQR